MGDRILAVDDNQKIREVATVLLENEDYEVGEAGDREAVVARAEDMGLIILDVMMPKVNGFRAYRQIHEVMNTLVLFLTVKTMDQDRALGLSSGGDDYLVKPFPYNEPIVRVKALLRRYCIYRGKEEPQESDQIIMHDLIISQNSNQVKKREEAVDLTEMECQILLLLTDHPKRTFSNQGLYEAIWKGSYMYFANSTIMVHIRDLYKKLGVDPQNPVYIKTV